MEFSSPSQFNDTVIYIIEQEVEKIGFSFIKIAGNPVARNMLLYK